MIIRLGGTGPGPSPPGPGPFDIIGGTGPGPSPLGVLGQARWCNLMGQARSRWARPAGGTGPGPLSLGQARLVR